jgi:uncharacterized protein (DUF58 family)
VLKKYEEERELTVLLLVDVSGSEMFGSQRKLKAEVVAEIAGMLAYAAIHTGDKVGVVLFAGEVEKIIPPKKGRKHVLRIISDLLTYKASTKGTDLEGALRAADRVMKHGGIVFLLSDFIATGYETALKKVSSRHEVVAVSVGDERELEMPDVGQILVVDPESGEERYIDTASYAFKKWMADFKRTQESRMQDALKTGWVERLKISTGEDYGEAVVRFFRARAKRRK